MAECVQIRLLKRKVVGRNEAQIREVLPTVRSLGLRSVHTSFSLPVIPEILRLQALWGTKRGHTRTSAKSTMGPVTLRLPNKPAQPHKAQMEQGQAEVPLSQLQQVSVSTQNLGCSPSILQQTLSQPLVQQSLLPYLQRLREAQQGCDPAPSPTAPCCLGTELTASGDAEMKADVRGLPSSRPQHPHLWLKAAALGEVGRGMGAGQMPGSIPAAPGQPDPLPSHPHRHPRAPQLLLCPQAPARARRGTRAVLPPAAASRPLPCTPQ